mmetsp:Transcript_8122/g.27263  ORF Transcript_8122/g.27263 Transcript_8122/m.27263 type:complete len:539 (+) Transcript_8122:2197-3813(+)
MLHHLPHVAVAISRELQGGAGDAEVVPLLDQPRDLLGLEGHRRDVKISSGNRPDELAGVILLEQQLLLLDPTRHPDLLPDVEGRQSSVSRRHGDVMGALQQMLHDLCRVSSDLTSKRNESYEVEVTLDVFPRRTVSCRLRLLRLTRFRCAQVPRGKSKNSHPPLRHGAVGAVVVGRLLDEEGGDDFRGSLDERESGRRRTGPILHGSQHAHALELRGEVIPMHYLDCDIAGLNAMGLLGRHRRLRPRIVLPSYRVDRCHLNRVPHHFIAHLDQRMAASKDDCCFPLGPSGRQRILLRAHAGVPGADTDKLVSCQGASLVEEAVLDLASKGDPERFSAEHARSEQGEHSCVHRNCRLHRKLRRHDAGEDQNTSQNQLILGALSLLQPLVQHVPARNEGKDEEEGKEGKDFLGIRQHLLLGVLDHPDELSLARREPSPHAIADAPTVRSDQLVGVRGGGRGVVLHHGGPAIQHVNPVRFLDVKLLVGGRSLCQQRFLHLGSTLPRQCCLVHHHTPAEDQSIAGDRHVFGSPGEREDVARK